MKKFLLFFTLTLGVYNLNAQMSCSELMEYVKSKSYGTTYYSFDSSAVSQITFYNVTDNNYNAYYFAIVKFTNSYKEYIYQVNSDTELNYSMNYTESAGKAFWKYIKPYNEILNCAPN